MPNDPVDNSPLETQPVESTLKTNQEFVLTAEPVDADGNAAAIEGNPRWDTDDPALVEVTPSDDGRSAIVRCLGPVGETRVHCTVDADLGSGVREVNNFCDVTIEQGGAVRLVLVAGTPRPISR